MPKSRSTNKREKPCRRVKRLKFEKQQLKDKVSKLKKECRGLEKRLFGHSDLHLDKQREIDKLQHDVDNFKSALRTMNIILESCDRCYGQYVTEYGLVMLELNRALELHRPLDYSGNDGGNSGNSGEQQLATTSVKIE